MINFVDLTHTLLPTGTPAYPGDPPFSARPIATIADDGASVHLVSCSSHSGTHIDAPSHFVLGAEGVGELALGRLVGRAVVLDLEERLDLEGSGERVEVRWEMLVELGVEERVRRAKNKADGGSVMLLLRTGWDKYWKPVGEAKTEDDKIRGKYLNHPFLSPDAAQHIVQLGVSILGIDTLSPDPTPTDSPDQSCNAEDPQYEFAVHKILLGAGVLIAENLTNLGALLVRDKDTQEDSENDCKWTVCLAPLKIGGGCDGSPVRAFAWREA